MHMNSKMIIFKNSKIKIIIMHPLEAQWALPINNTCYGYYIQWVCIPAGKLV